MMFKKSKVQRASESGKTMLETLMALVIMGVLTMVSATLYIFLVHRWESIETLNLINKAVAGVRTGSFTKYLEEQSEEYIDTPDYLLSEEAMPVKMYISEVTAPSIQKQGWYGVESFEAPRGTVIATYPAVNGDGVVVGLHQLPKELCEEVLKHDLGWDYAMKIEGGNNGYQPVGGFIKYAEMDRERRSALCAPVVDHISAEIDVSDLGLAFNLSEGEDRPECPMCTREFLGRCVLLDEAKCGENQALKMDTCQCYCLWEQAGVECCAEGEHASNGHCCPKAEEWDDRTNSCRCPDCPVVGMRQDAETCECECPRDTDAVLEEGAVVLCCPEGTVANHDKTACIVCPEGNLPPSDKCYTYTDYPETLDCPKYTMYTEEACECSSGYGKTACVEGSQYETATETLKDGTVCYKCADCPMGNEKPTNACYTEVVTPADATTGCPAYTTYTTKPCECPSGYSKTACPTGQYATDTQKMTDGTMCYKCTSCPTGNSKPTNACYTEVTTPADATTGCPAYTTYTTKPCECPSGYSKTACPTGQYATDTQKMTDGTMCYKCKSTTCAYFGKSDGVKQVAIWGDKCNRSGVGYTSSTPSIATEGTDGSASKQCPTYIEGYVCFLKDQTVNNVTIGTVKYPNNNKKANGTLASKNLFVPQNYTFQKEQCYYLRANTGVAAYSRIYLDLSLTKADFACH